MVDDDGSGSELIGYIETTVGALMGAPNQVFESDLGTPQQGKIIVRTEAVNDAVSQNYAKFVLKWSNLNNLSKGFIGIGKKRMAVRFEIGRQIPGTDKFAGIYCSSHIKQKSPDFEVPVVVSMIQLCNNNLDLPLRFSVWNKGNKMLN